MMKSEICTLSEKYVENGKTHLIIFDYVFLIFFLVLLKLSNWSKSTSARAKAGLTDIVLLLDDDVLRIVSLSLIKENS